MRQLLNIDTWSRKEHYAFFNTFEEPFWGATIRVDCTEAYSICVDNSVSFFVYYLHKALAAANNILEFRYRIEENQVWVYDKIHAASTIGRTDHSFGFSYMAYDKDFSTFKKTAQHEIDRVKATSGLGPPSKLPNVIHFSSLPWLDFSAISHARSFARPDSSPKISFGQMVIEKNGRRSMPVSIHVHHALADGYHVGLFVQQFQKLLDGRD